MFTRATLGLTQSHMIFTGIPFSYKQSYWWPYMDPFSSYVFSPVKVQIPADRKAARPWAGTMPPPKKVHRLISIRFILPNSYGGKFIWRRILMNVEYVEWVDSEKNSFRPICYVDRAHGVFIENWETWFSSMVHIWYSSGWWFGTLFIFPYTGNNHPNWLIFFRGVETTNQMKCWWLNFFNWNGQATPDIFQPAEISPGETWWND